MQNVKAAVAGWVGGRIAMLRADGSTGRTRWTEMGKGEWEEEDGVELRRERTRSRTAGESARTASKPIAVRLGANVRYGVPRRECCRPQITKLGPADGKEDDETCGDGERM
eukprot:6205872-Pleurochrysis_carterae.AAC.3